MTVGHPGTFNYAVRRNERTRRARYYMPRRLLQRNIISDREPELRAVTRMSAVRRPPLPPKQQGSDDDHASQVDCRGHPGVSQNKHQDGQDNPEYAGPDGDENRIAGQIGIDLGRTVAFARHAPSYMAAEL